MNSSKSTCRTKATRTTSTSGKRTFMQSCCCRERHYYSISKLLRQQGVISCWKRGFLLLLLLLLFMSSSLVRRQCLAFSPSTTRFLLRHRTKQQQLQLELLSQTSRSVSIMSRSSRYGTSVLEDFLLSDSQDDTFEPPPDILMTNQLKMIHLPSVTSTQDEVRKIVLSQSSSFSPSKNNTNKDAHNNNNDYTVLAVMADEQTAGRGTQGRLWDSPAGGANLYLTLALPVQAIPIQPMTLLPLQVGVWVAQRVHTILQSCCSCHNNHDHDASSSSSSHLSSFPKVTVKWPNDVLINQQQKVSGTLIENCNDMFLIGIGVNVLYRPTLTGLPGKHGRAAACLQDFCTAAAQLKQGTAAALGWDLALTATEWITTTYSSPLLQLDGMSSSPQERGLALVDEWSSWAEFDQIYELRGQRVDVEAGGYEGEKVVTLGIAPDGQLRVRGANGQERLLSADYLV